MGKKTIKDVRNNDLSKVFIYLSINGNARVSRIILLAVEYCKSLKLGFVIVMHEINCLVFSIFDVLSV